VYEERYQDPCGFWRPVIGTVVRKFLECGDLKQGFARVRCQLFNWKDVLTLKEGRQPATWQETLRLLQGAGVFAKSLRLAPRISRLRFRDLACHTRSGVKNQPNSVCPDADRLTAHWRAAV